jgi:hypothetical protein
MCLPEGVKSFADKFSVGHKIAEKVGGTGGALLDPAGGFNGEYDEKAEEAPVNKLKLKTAPRHSTQTSATTSANKASRMSLKIPGAS